jgi:hypothetical protein
MIRSSISLAAVLLLVSCSSDEQAKGGTGGAEAGGTAGATGGTPSAGGTNATGGVISDGGAGTGGSSTGGSATGGASGSGGAATDAGSGGRANVEAGAGTVSPVEGCQYQGVETANCASGQTNYWECGAATSTDSPDPSCVRPTDGANIATRWCCADPFCSRISVVTQVCSQVYPASPNGFSCDPDVRDLALCRKQAGNAACCPF